MLYYFTGNCTTVKHNSRPVSVHVWILAKYMERKLSGFSDVNCPSASQRVSVASYGTLRHVLPLTSNDLIFTARRNAAWTLFSVLFLVSICWQGVAPFPWYLNAKGPTRLGSTCVAHRLIAPQPWCHCVLVVWLNFRAAQSLTATCSVYYFASFCMRQKVSCSFAPSHQYLATRHCDAECYEDGRDTEIARPENATHEMRARRLSVLLKMQDVKLLEFFREP